jgi:hypothetical protein
MSHKGNSNSPRNVNSLNVTLKSGKIKYTKESTRYPKPPMIIKIPRANGRKFDLKIK